MGHDILSKNCTRCKEDKSLDLFHRSKRYGHQHWCKSCNSSYRRANYDKRRAWLKRKSEELGYGFHRKYNLPKAYGITIEDYDKMFSDQDGRCAICRTLEEDTKITNATQRKRLHVDHCHKTGKVRGLLCTCCNNVLGRAKDSIEILKAAIEYLERNKEDTMKSKTESLTTAGELERIGTQHSKDSAAFDAAIQRYLADFSWNLDEDEDDLAKFDEDTYRYGRM